jgi:TRAP-type mannitol/chloroaromatic compound transport system substrate-binding protein
VQSTWPASLTIQDHLRILADRIDKLTSGSVKIEAMAAARSCRRSKVLDATNKKVLDGYHAISYYWVGKSPTMALFSGPPGGPFGMDHMDYLGWLYVGGGLDMWREFYQKEMKLDITMWPAHPSSPQAVRLVQEAAQERGRLQGHEVPADRPERRDLRQARQSVVNMAGGEIVPPRSAA